jgi:hypothetical protein
MVEPFAFHAELFELRTAVLELLADHGFVWLSDIGSIDLAHDLYGIEVCGIREESDAHTIEKLLGKKFSSWRHSRIYFKDQRTLEPGWKVIISRDAEDFGESWDRVS